MLRDLLLFAARPRHFRVLSVLRAYRRIRERLGEEESPGFEVALVSETAATTGCSEEQVLEIVAEWILERPLAYLEKCRYPGVPALFAALKRKGKIVGILSDYPAVEKLAALGLKANHIVSALDDGIGLLKPHTRGLEVLMDAAGVTAQTTVVIGDRPDRDGLVARRVGARALIRSSKPIEGWQTFASYEDRLFDPLLR